MGRGKRVYPIDQTADTDFQRDFPNLKDSDVDVTSLATTSYNCIAWAADDATKWWWPVANIRGFYWPPTIPKELALERFIQAFETLGYGTCESDDFVEGVEKIAIYVDSSGEPTHVARQLESGMWTSKLGSEWDIAHGTLAALEDGAYGTVVHIMERPRR